MIADGEYERNFATYQGMKEMIERTYPKDWFVGIAAGQIVGAAMSFQELEAQLRAEGKDSKKTLVIESGVAYSELVTIFV